MTAEMVMIDSEVAEGVDVTTLEKYVKYFSFRDFHFLPFRDMVGDKI